MSFLPKGVTAGFLLVFLMFSSMMPAFADTRLDQYQDILISPKAPAVVTKAATDLQYHLQKIAGREFPLVKSAQAPKEGLHFIVGSGVLPEQDAAIAALPREGWLMRSVPRGLLLGGNEKNLSSSEPYLAVPLFLEKVCGVRWVWPGENGEVIPHSPQLVIPALEESGAPKLKRRKLDFYYARWWDSTTVAELDIWKGRVRLGDQLRANFGHAWGSLIPGEIYFEKHPEWFGLVDGKRIPLQICPSNLEMRDEFVKRLLSLPANQKLDIVSVSASDGYGFCECELCKTKAVGDQDYKNAAYWDLVNDVAKRVKVLRPELGIGSFAYTTSRNPPKNIERLPDNVYLSMTTYAQQLMRPEEKTKYEAFIKEWESKGVKIVLRDYWGMHYWMDLPVLFPDEIATTFKLANEAGMIGAYGETGKNFSTQAPNYYVLTHMMWDPSADPQAILDDFYSTFGPAAKPVRAYYELLESEVAQAWNKYQLIGGFTQLVLKYGEIFSPEVMARAISHLDEAARVAGDEPKLKERIAFVRTGAEYTALMGELLELYDKLGRTGFPLEAFEWEATVAPRRFVTQTPDNTDGREAFEERLKEPFTYTLAEKDAWLVRAWDLGQKRIELLNRNRLNFAVDEGLYATTLEGRHHHSMPPGIRQWHQTVGKYLGKTEAEMVVLNYTRPAKKD